MADINLTGDASQLVSAINQATTAFIGFEQATARVQRDQAKFNKDGQIVARTLTAIDAAGNKVVTTFKEVKGVLTQTSTVSKGAAANLRAYSIQARQTAAAQELLAQATATGVDAQLAQADALRQTAASARTDARVLIQQAEQHGRNAAGAKNSANALRALEADSRKTTRAIELLTVANEAETLSAELAAAANVRAAEAVDLRARAASIQAGIPGLAARAPEVQKQSAQRIADEKRVAEEFKKQTTQRITDEEALAALRIKGILQVTQLERERVTATAAQRVTDENRVAALFKAQAAARIVEDDKVVAARVASQLAAATERRAQIKGTTAQRLAAEQRVAAAFKTQAAARVLAEEGAIAARIQGVLEASQIERERVTAVAAQRVGDERRVAAAFKAQIATRTAEEEKAIGLRIAAELKVGDARRNQIRRATVQQLSDEQRVAAAFKSQVAERIADEERVIAARVRGQLEANTARLRQLKQATAQRLADERRVAAEFIRLENQRRAAAIQTRTPRVEQRLATGGAGRAETSAFLQAEEAVRRFGATGVTAAQQVDAAIAQARAGLLRFTGNLTQAELAALRLVEAENRVAAGMDAAAASSNGLLASVASLGKLIGISLLIGATFRLVTAFTDAARAAGELSIKIAEIQTISSDAAATTESWASNLRDLSSEFGIDTLKQAEGAYQILSNQIKDVEGATVSTAQALKVLEVANRLAITGVTDTANATNLLTAALNSFKLPAEDADIIAAKLFKTVELGRLRVEDLSNIFGRVAVPARQLGLSIDEVLGSIAGLTIQGFRADEAITGIRNVILKLIKPTKTGKEAIKGLGFETGQSLIQTRGFIGGLQDFVKQVEESGKSVEVFGDAFGRIRAIVGALGLVGENADLTAANIEKIKKATLGAFDDDTRKVIGSTGQQLKIASQQAKNFFEESIGTPALQAIAAFIKDAGGMDKILQSIGDTLTIVGDSVKLAFTALTIKLIVGSALALKAYAVAALEAAAAIRTVSAAQATFLGTLLLHPVLAAVTAIAAATTAISFAARKSAISDLRDVERASAASLKRQQASQKELTAARQVATRQLQDEFTKRVKVVRESLTEIRKRQLETVKSLTETAKNTGEQFKIIVKGFRTSVTKQLSDSTRAIKKFEKDSKTAAQTVQNILKGVDSEQLKIDVNIAGFGRRISLLEDEIQRARGRVEKATEAADIKAFNRERKLLNDLVKQRITAEVKFAGEASKLQKARVEAQLQREKARTRSERQAADDRISSIDRQQKILRDGTAAQLNQERAIQKVREEVSLADDAAAIKRAVVQLSALKREQERINALAIQERRIRAQSAKDRIEQAKQAEKIRIANEKSAKIERERAQRLRGLQLLFNLIAKDAEKFRIERVTEGKTAEGINKAVREQQKRLAKLQTLAGALGGSETQEIFIKREETLRKRAQAQIDILESRAQKKRLDELETLGRKRLGDITKATKAEETRIALATQSINRFQDLLDIPSLASGNTTLSGNVARRGLGIPFQEGRDGRASTQPKELDDQFRGLVSQSKTLNSLIAKQRASFSDTRQTQIKSIVDTLTKFLDPAQLEKTRLRRFSGSGVRDSQSTKDAKDVNQTSLALLADLRGLSSALESLKTRSTEAGELLKAFPALAESKARKESTDTIKKELTARQKLNKVIQEVLDIRSGRKRLSGGPATAPEAIGPISLPEIVRTIGKPIGDAARKAIRRGMTQGTKDALPDIAKALFSAATMGASDGLQTGTKEAAPVATDAAKKAGRAQAKAQAKQTVKQTPALTRQIAQLEATLKKRIAAAGQRAEARKRDRVRQTEKPIDDTIRLGRGAPSIASQQARIRTQLDERDRRREAFLKAQREARADARRRRQIAGRTRVATDRATGRLVTRGRGNINRRGLFTRGRGNFDSQGRPISRRQRGRGIAPKLPVTKTPEKIAQENRDQNAKSRVALESIQKNGIKVQRGDTARGKAAEKAVERSKTQAKTRLPGQTGQPTAKTPGIAPGQEGAVGTLKKFLQNRRRQEEEINSLKQAEVRNLKSLMFLQEADLDRQKKLQGIDPRKRTSEQQRELLFLRKRSSARATAIQRLEEEKALDERIKAAKKTIADETERARKAVGQGDLDLPVVPEKLNQRLIAARKELADAEAEKARRAKKLTPAEQAAAAEKLRIARIQQDADIKARARGEKTPFAKPSSDATITNKTLEAAEKQKEAAELMIQAFQARLPKSSQQLDAERRLQFENAKRGISPKPIRTQTLPFGQFRPAGEIAPAPITNVGGIKVEIIGGTQNPKEIARLVVPEIQRGIRQGLIRLTPSRGRAR